MVNQMLGTRPFSLKKEQIYAILTIDLPLMEEYRFDMTSNAVRLGVAHFQGILTSYGEEEKFVYMMILGCEDSKILMINIFVSF